jgi:hypothetical protein
LFLPSLSYCGLPDACRQLSLRYKTIIAHLQKRKASADGHYFRFERARNSGGGAGGVITEQRTNLSKTSTSSSSLEGITGIKVRKVSHDAKGGGKSVGSGDGLRSPGKSPVRSPMRSPMRSPVRSPLKKGQPAQTATAADVAAALARAPDPTLVAHFLHFALCQV